MSDWSYRKGMPRSQAHYERYGNYDVPARRGMGGVGLADDSSWLWLLALAGLLIIASKKR